MAIQRRFAFNCHRHWAVILVRAGNGHALFVHSKEGVTQGDPLAVVACGIAILPLIRILKAAVPDVHQPWHADDAGDDSILQSFKSMVPRGAISRSQVKAS